MKWRRRKQQADAKRLDPNFGKSARKKKKIDNGKKKERESEAHFGNVSLVINRVHQKLVLLADGIKDSEQTISVEINPNLGKKADSGYKKAFKR